jgi:CheY-like chemotaxis protein
MAISAHSLKSVGAHLDARMLSQACGALEKAARAGNDAEVRSLVDDVSAACQDLLTKLAVAPAESLSVRAPRQDVAQTDSGATDAKGPMRTALVVDDEPNDQFFLRRILESQGYRVKACWSGEAAVGACNDEEPDLVILDGRMPGMDGVDTCRAIRAICSSRLPIVVVTGVADPNWRATAYEAGADKILDKDVSIEMLRSNLISAIDSLQV